MSFQNSLDAFVSQVVQYQPTVGDDGPRSPQIKLVSSLVLFVRWLFAGPIVRRVTGHWVNGRLLPCTKDASGNCKLCDLVSEALQLGREPKIVNRYVSKQFVLAYAHIFRHEGGNTRVQIRDNTPSLLIAEKGMMDGLMTQLKRRDPQELEMAFNPQAEGSVWKISNKGNKVECIDDKLESMPDLPEDTTPIDKVLFDDGAEVSDSMLEFARKAILKTPKSQNGDDLC